MKNKIDLRLPIFTGEELKRVFGNFKLKRREEEREWILNYKDLNLFLEDAGNGWFKLVGISKTKKS